MYKDVLEKLNKDRRVNDKFIQRLENNGFEVKYGKYSYWNGCEYIQIGTQKIWLVEELTENNSSYVEYRYRNDVVEEIKDAIEEQKTELAKEEKLLDEVLPIR